jgi:hypothetical protein
MASPLPFARDATRKSSAFSLSARCALSDFSLFVGTRARERRQNPGDAVRLLSLHASRDNVGMQKKVCEILSLPYGQDNICCEPSKEEVQKAVDEKDLETRGFQEHEHELRAEWEQVSGPERHDRVRKYHARRVAFFVVNGWDNYPIVLKEDGREVSEGSHRLRAARHLGMETVEVAP